MNRDFYVFSPAVLGALLRAAAAGRDVDEILIRLHLMFHSVDGLAKPSPLEVGELMDWLRDGGAG